MADEATTADADESEWDGIPNRSPDLRANYTPPIRHDPSDDENMALKHMVGRTWDYSDHRLDPERVAVEGDYAVVRYKSKQSGTVLSRHGEIETGFHPTASKNTQLRIRDSESGKQLLAGNQQGVTLYNDNARYGSGKKKRQNLGTLEAIEVYFSADHRENGLPFDLPPAQPGDTIRYEFDGETRLQKVDGYSNGGALLKLDYPYDYDAKEIPSFIDYAEKYDDAKVDGANVIRTDIERVDTLKPTDKMVTLDGLNWEIADKNRNKVIMAGFKNDELVVRRKLRVEATDVRVDDDWVEADDDGYWAYADGHATPDADALADVVDLPVEGADTGVDE